MFPKCPVRSPPAAHSAYSGIHRGTTPIQCIPAAAHLSSTNGRACGVSGVWVLRLREQFFQSVQNRPHRHIVYTAVLDLDVFLDERRAHVKRRRVRNDFFVIAPRHFAVNHQFVFHASISFRAERSNVLTLQRSNAAYGIVAFVIVATLSVISHMIASGLSASPLGYTMLVTMPAPVV